MPINLKDYHPKWSLIRRLVMKRAGEVREGNNIIKQACCEDCGQKNGELSQSKWNDLKVPTLPSLFAQLDPDLVYVLKHYTIKRIILTTAHLDHDRYNNRFSNLKCLCQKCHLKHDLAQRVFSFKYGKETQYKNGKLF